MSAAIDSDGVSLRVNHAALKNSETYTVTVGAGAVKSKAGGIGNEEIRWSFTTSAPTGPELAYTNPWDGETGVYTSSDIGVIFDSEIQAGDLSLVSIKDSRGAGPEGISAAIDSDGVSLRVNHAALKGSETYTVTVGAGAVKSKASGIGNEEIRWSFTTSAPTGPEPVYTNPWDGEVNVNTDIDIEIIFDKGIEFEDLSQVSITDSQGVSVEIVYTEIDSNGTSFKINNAALKNSETYTVTVGAGAVKSKASGIGNEEIRWSFTTAAPSDFSFPAKVDVPTDKQWVITFNKELDPFAAVEAFIQIADSKNNSVDIIASIDSNGKSILVNPPQGGYTPGETYYLTIEKGIKSKTGQTTSTSVRMQFTIKK